MTTKRNSHRFKPFKKQKKVIRAVLKDGKRFVGAFAGKRGGKTEVGAIISGALHERRPGYKPNGIDPHLGIIAAPTYDMLRRLSWKKFLGYWRKFLKKAPTKNPMEMIWHNSVDGDESLIYGISADKPERLEGVKANWIWIDEVFQVSEQFFLECMARVADTGGFVICTGSLGVQFINPKQHWAYKYFKENIHKDQTFACFEWTTADNPFFSKEEIERLRKTLDPVTFAAMFTITWDLTPKSAVYYNWSTANEIRGYKFNPDLETYISIDWGWAHPMCCGFYQYDRKNDIVYKFDEIFGSKITLDALYKKICERPFIKTIKKKRIDTLTDGRKVEVEYDFITNIKAFVCDIAGDQEREQLGRSNIKYMKEKYGIEFKRRKSAILKGVSIVRSYIQSATGFVRLFIDVEKCPETEKGIKRYGFPVKDGIIQNENPIKKDDDAADETRYFFWNILDPDIEDTPTITVTTR